MTELSPSSSSLVPNSDSTSRSASVRSGSVESRVSHTPRYSSRDSDDDQDEPPPDYSFTSPEPQVPKSPRERSNSGFLGGIKSLFRGGSQTTPQQSKQQQSQPQARASLTDDRWSNQNTSTGKNVVNESQRASGNRRTGFSTLLQEELDDLEMEPAAVGDNEVTVPPPPPKTDADYIIADLLQSGEWSIAFDPDTGRPYYYSTVDFTTTWDLGTLIRKFRTGVPSPRKSLHRGPGSAPAAAGRASTVSHPKVFTKAAATPNANVTTYSSPQANPPQPTTATRSQQSRVTVSQNHAHSTRVLTSYTAPGSAANNNYSDLEDARRRRKLGYGTSSVSQQQQEQPPQRVQTTSRTRSHTTGTSGVTGRAQGGVNVDAMFRELEDASSGGSFATQAQTNELAAPSRQQRFSSRLRSQSATTGAHTPQQAPGAQQWGSTDYADQVNVAPVPAAVLDDDTDVFALEAQYQQEQQRVRASSERHEDAEALDILRRLNRQEELARKSQRNTWESLGAVGSGTSAFGGATKKSVLSTSPQRGSPHNATGIDDAASPLERRTTQKTQLANKRITPNKSSLLNLSKESVDSTAVLAAQARVRALANSKSKFVSTPSSGYGQRPKRQPQHEQRHVSPWGSGQQLHVSAPPAALSLSTDSAQNSRHTASGHFKRTQTAARTPSKAVPSLFARSATATPSQQAPQSAAAPAPLNRSLPREEAITPPPPSAIATTARGSPSPLRESSPAARAPPLVSVASGSVSQQQQQSPSASHWASVVDIARSSVPAEASTSVPRAQAGSPVAGATAGAGSLHRNPSPDVEPQQYLHSSPPSEQPSLRSGSGGETESRCVERTHIAQRPGSNPTSRPTTPNRSRTKAPPAGQTPPAGRKLRENNEPNVVVVKKMKPRKSMVSERTWEDEVRRREEMEEKKRQMIVEARREKMRKNPSGPTTSNVMLATW